MTTIRLAVGHNEGCMLSGLAPEHKPYAALLCSYFYVEKFDRHRERIAFRDWTMDSGAFTAWNMGKPIDLEAYIEACRERLDEDPELYEVFALDVIGNSTQTRANVERMWEAGVPAIPVYHYGEPLELLQHYAATYPKIALGGVATLRGTSRHQWMRQCFARIWPKLVHGFAVTTETDVLCVPWDSVDSSSWQAPAQFGQSKAFKIGSAGRSRGQPGRRMRTGYRSLARPEVEWYLELERKAKARWRRPLEEALRATVERFPGYPYRQVPVAGKA